MKRTLAAVLAAGMLAAATGSAFAVDSHGNASNPERARPELRWRVGRPAHRDDPRRQRGP